MKPSPPRRLQRARLIAAPIGMATLAGCGATSAPPPVARHETPGEHIQRIGTVWEERTAVEGFSTGQSAIDRFQIEGRMEITLRGPSAKGASEVLERTETFTLRDGRVFHCTASASTDARVVQSTRGTEAALRIESPALVLSRRCREPGYPDPEERLDAAAVTFVLRGDRLVAVDPPLARNVLVPIR